MTLRRAAFFEGAIDMHGVPEKITIDKSGSNTAAIVSIQGDSGLPIEMRQSKYLNNIVEQDRRARILIAGIETMHIIRKGQLGNIKDVCADAGLTRQDHVCRRMVDPGRHSQCRTAPHRERDEAGQSEVGTEGQNRVGSNIPATRMQHPHPAPCHCGYGETACTNVPGLQCPRWPMCAWLPMPSASLRARHLQRAPLAAPRSDCDRDLNFGWGNVRGELAAGFGFRLPTPRGLSGEAVVGVTGRPMISAGSAGVPTGVSFGVDPGVLACATAQTANSANSAHAAPDFKLAR
jgi:hypothetical protein